MLRGVERMRHVGESREAWAGTCASDLLRMADEIEAEVAGRYAELPVDADGVTIHLGDHMEYYGARVERIVLKADGEHSVYLAKLPNVLHECLCCEIAHHEPTVEDVLREFGDWYAHVRGGCDEDGVIAEYAAKLRLAEEATRA